MDHQTITIDEAAPLSERDLVLDPKRPRMLCRCASAVATALLRADRCPSPDRRAALQHLEEGLERVRRMHPEAWRAERHVDTLGRLMALDVREAALASPEPALQTMCQAGPYAKASGSAALRSATKAVSASPIAGSSGGGV